MRRIAVALSVAVGMVVLIGTAVVTAVDLTPVATLDPAAFELPEAMALDHQGNIYASMAFSGEIKRISPDGVTATYASLPSPGSGFMTGLAFDSKGNLYVGMGSFDPATHGIWIVDKAGNATQFASLTVGGAPDGLPNDLAFDQLGNLYVSDTIGGKIWKIAKNGDVSTWITDASLLGLPPGPPLCPPACFPKGANGIVFDHGHHNLFVGNSDLGTIVRIPFSSRGEAGTPEVFASNPLIIGVDGITMDNHGMIYVASLFNDHIATVSSQGVVSLLVAGEPLQSPSDVVLSQSGKALYVSNFALLRFLGVQPGTPEPAILKTPVSAKP